VFVEMSIEDVERMTFEIISFLRNGFLENMIRQLYIFNLVSILQSQ
jgi:hypothetical protein